MFPEACHRAGRRLVPTEELCRASQTQQDFVREVGELLGRVRLLKRVRSFRKSTICTTSKWDLSVSE